jgi:histidinol-phosphate aminotransferase
LAQNALSSSGVQLMKRYIASIKLQRDFVLKELEKLPFVGGFLGTHDANFILAQIVNKNGVPCNEAAFKIYKTLAEKEGVVVRYRGNELGCQGCLRITIGTKEENQVLLHKLSIIQ